MEHILNLILRLRRLFSGRNDLFGGLSLKFHCSDGWGMKLSATNPLVIENKLNGWWNVHQETFFTIAVSERCCCEHHQIWIVEGGGKSWRWWRIKWDKATQPEHFPSKDLKYFLPMHFWSENKNLSPRQVNMLCSGGTIRIDLMSWLPSTQSSCIFNQRYRGKR